MQHHVPTARLTHDEDGRPVLEVPATDAAALRNYLLTHGIRVEIVSDDPESGVVRLAVLNVDDAWTAVALRHWKP